MYITSKYHDYYDSASAYGIDKECVYRRDLKEIDIPKINLPYWAEKHTHGFKLTLRPMILGFCGDIYPAVVFEYEFEKNVYPLIAPVPKNEIVYNFDVYRTRLQELGVSLDSGKRFFWHRDYLDHDKGAENFFNDNYDDFKDLFRKYHVPIFSLQHKPSRTGFVLTLNPKLNTIQFMKVKDPHTAFQDIFMYLSGVLGNKEKDTVKISDKDMLKQKGFDQYSFKTGKGEKKPRAKNRGKE